MASRIGYFTLSDTIQPMLDRTAKRYRQHRVYRQTIGELQSLSSRDLADLGITRSSIHALAREAAENVL